MALPVAEAPGPVPCTFTPACALPAPAVESLVEPLLVSVPLSSPAAPALAEDPAVEPLPLLALELAFPLAEEPAPLALAPALELELAPAEPALLDELLEADALAAAAGVALTPRFVTSTVMGVAIKASASALAETMSPNLKLLGRCMGILLNSCENGSPLRSPNGPPRRPACARPVIVMTSNGEECSGWR